MKVIPVINCPDIECVTKKLEILKGFYPEGGFVHLDVTDGSFATHATWADPMAWPTLKSPFALEVHLMVHHPEDYVDNWLTAGARRLIVHAEALTPPTMHIVTSAAERRGAEVMISTKPATASEDVESYLKHFRLFQVLAVNPGPAGQTYLEFSDEKIRFLREEFPDATIEVDGGMTPLTAYRVKELGADIVVSSKYIFDADDPKKAYEELAKI